LAKLNFPPLSVTTEWSKPLTGLRISTVALGMTAPVESTTLPLIEPEFPTDCDQTAALKRMTTTMAMNCHLDEVGMSPPELVV
jgi:hypothetical protein